MPSRQQLERALVKVGKAAPPSVRGRLGRATRTVRGRWQGPLVTVVVAVSDEETARVTPCLQSLRVQTHPNIDVRVVPYGSAAGALAAARAQAAEDWRIRIDGPAADLAEAWNSGAARSKAPYVMFARGGDDLPVPAVERLVGTLEETGSDLAVGRIEPPFTLHASVESPFEAAHHTEVRSTTLAESPVAITDLGVGNRLFRTAFWRSSGLAFDPRDRLGTDLALASYLRATSFDLTTDAAYIPTGRREGVTLGAVRDVLAELELWLREHDVTRAEVERLDLPDVVDWWLWGVLDSAIQPFLGDIERATPEQWSMLREHVERLVSAGGESAWASLRADSRVKLRLVLEDRRDRLEEYVVQRLFDRDSRRTEVRDGRVYAHLPYFGDPEVGIPDDEYEMRDVETSLWAGLQRITWESPEELRLGVFARIRHITLDTEPVLRAWLVERRSGNRIPLEVRLTVDPSANLADGSRYQDFSRGAATLHVPVAELSARARELGRQVRWTLELEMTAAGLTRRGPLTSVDDRGSAGMIETGHLGDRRVSGARVGVRGRTAARFTLVAEPAAGPELVDADVAGSTVRLTVRSDGSGLKGARFVAEGGVAVRARVSQIGDLAEIMAELPRRHPLDAPRRFALRAVSADGRTVPVAWPAAAPQWLAVGTGEVAVSRSESGHVDVVDASGILVAEDLRLGEGQVEMDARWLGTPPASWAVRLVRKQQVVEGKVEERGDGLLVRFPTTWDEWGLGETPVPAGRYQLELTHGAAEHPGRVELGEDLLGRVLTFSANDEFRFRPFRTGREGGVFLMPPLADDERGQYYQTALLDWYRSCDLPVEDDLVYLQAYAGATATDSQLAIHEELRRTRPDLRIYWGVADRASVVPEGGVPVLLHSREWYRVMATARYLCMNIDPERWFELRPGQQLLQTFHGYPAKSMGIRMWEAKGYTPRRVDLELQRTSGDWSLILTPAPEMDEHYRREYRYDGPIHSAGYPRDDALVSADAPRVREETRRRLGIAPHQKAVLYAPTWRDDLAINWRRAEMVTHLDVEAASRRLGPDYVLLMRGHRFHAQTTETAGTARLVDVTTYPEINDLILAADAAVLDYSSLRFDFALSGRPMLFLVPDLATYTGGVRGFLYPFEDSAPGPLLDTADEVLARLRDLDELDREYATAIKRFNETYNYLQDGKAAERVVKAFFG